MQCLAEAMAGLTSTTFFPFKPLPYRRKLLSLSSFQSKLFGFRLNNPNSSSIHLSFVISASRASIAARYGDAGGGFSQSESSDSDEDEDLDMSTIRSEKVRLIDEKQNMVGIVFKSLAVQMAEDAELDLVIVSPDADPPVVKIMDYNKYKYELQKKKRDQQKKSAAHRMDLKELKMGYNIDVHDYSVRLKAAKKFLKDGDKVKVIVNLKGRENQFRNNAIQLLRRFQNDIGELAVEESKNFRERNITLVLVPNKVVVQKAQELPKKKEKSTATEVSASV